jgi:hypothetical protein
LKRHPAAKLFSDSLRLVRVIHVVVDGAGCWRFLRGTDQGRRPDAKRHIKHFPFETYGRKWLARKGQAIRAQSDFMRPLYEWGDALFANAVKI